MVMEEEASSDLLCCCATVHLGVQRIKMAVLFLKITRSRVRTLPGIKKKKKKKKKKKSAANSLPFSCFLFLAFFFSFFSFFLVLHIAFAQNPSTIKSNLRAKRHRSHSSLTEATELRAGRNYSHALISTHHETPPTSAFGNSVMLIEFRPFWFLVLLCLLTFAYFSNTAKCVCFSFIKPANSQPASHAPSFLSSLYD